MKLAKSILCGVAALGITAGAAVAQSDEQSPSVSNSESYYVLMEPVMVYEETYVLADPSSDGLVAWNDSPSETTTYYIYDVDGDMDGNHRHLIIEQSDTLAFAPSDADADYSSTD